MRVRLPLLRSLVLASVLGSGALHAEVPASQFSERLIAQAEQALPIEQFFYQYLLSEIAGQRGDAATATRNLIDLAARTRDAKVARRAVEIAYQAGQLDTAREGLTLWLELEPNSAMARQLLTRLAGGNLDISVNNLRNWLQDAKRAPTLLTQLPALLARHPDKARVLAAVRELTQPYLNRPEAHFALAQTELFAGNPAVALMAAESALVLRANWAAAAILKAQILRDNSDPGRTAASDYLRGFLTANPVEHDARMTYARLLVGERKLVQAREEFRQVARALPDDMEVAYAIALLSQQMGDSADAEAQYLKVLSLSPSDPSAVHYQLGDVAMLKKDTTAALQWYRKVGSGDYFVGAQHKIATLIAKRDGLAAGRKVLRDARAGDAATSEGALQMVMAEAQLLREFKSFGEAFQVLSDALGANPNHVDLLYERGMMAERVQKFDVLDTDLRRVIALKPDHAHAHNALGYTYAERGIRLDEAETLIDTAIKLAPDDPFIQDSLGWIQFRKGRKEEALATLRKAFQVRPDPEIAAHIGEVLWALGKREEARALWKAQLAEHPENESLLAVVKKFKP